MSLFTASLNSGSNGNCYYIGNGREAVLVDAGLACRETERRMKSLGLAMSAVKAIFISHEHGDHIRGLEGIVQKYQLPVYITANTLRQSRLRINSGLVHHFSAYQPVSIGALTIHSFPKLHDAIDPHSFIIEGNSTFIGVFTDIGAPCLHVIDHFTQCHAAYLEANYDPQMLSSGRYPPHLKTRISSDVGHLSNTQALDLFIAHRPPHMSHLFLSHLSQDNNTPALALGAFTPHAGNTRVTIASRHQPSPVFHINGTEHEVPVKKTERTAPLVQATLFQ